MDYQTARNFLIGQAIATSPNQDVLLFRLKQGKPPVPGQITAILLALKVLFTSVKDATTLDRELVYALYLLATQGQMLFEVGRRSGVEWPPLLKEDLKRIAIACESIFSGVWQTVH